MKEDAIKELVKDTTVEFTRYSAGKFYYKLENLLGQGFEFSVPMKDIEAGAVWAKEPAKKFEKYIRAYLAKLY